MTILKIDKNEYKYRLEFEGGKYLILPSKILYKYKLESGDNFDDKILNEYIKDKFYSSILKNETTNYELSLYGSGLRYLSLTNRSTIDTKNYLNKKVKTISNIIPPEISNVVINNLIVLFQSLGYINDNLYIERYFSKNVNKNKPKSLYLIKRELIQKGFDEKIVETSLLFLKENNLLSDNTDLNNALTIATKKHSILKNKGKDSNYIKKSISFALSQKGYNYNIILNVIEYLFPRT